jgi:predicted TIM-barrel fold metal-dependent hydrolase
VHVFDPKNYPYSPKRAYSPREASFQQLISFGKSLTVDDSTPNMVLVLPSPYGNLNESILDLIRKEEGGGKLRGIVVLDKDQMGREELIEMDKVGVRGVRLNMVSSGGKVTGDALRKAMTEVAELIKNAGLGERWWIQLFIPGHFWEGNHSISLQRSC